MASFLRAGLNLAEASEICMNQCHAMCCRGPLILSLSRAKSEPCKAKPEEQGEGGPNKRWGHDDAEGVGYGLSETLACTHAEGESVPGAGRAGTETVPHARRR